MVEGGAGMASSFAFKARNLAFPITLLLSLPLLPGCKEEAAPARQQAAAPPAAVFVARVERQAISRGADFVGRVEAIDKVDIAARVTGFLQARHFNEGDAIKAGQHNIQQH